MRFYKKSIQFLEKFSTDHQTGSPMFWWLFILQFCTSSCIDSSSKDTDLQAGQFPSIVVHRNSISKDALAVSTA